MSRYTRFATISAVAAIAAIAPLSAASAQDPSVGASGNNGVVTVPTVLDNSVTQDPGTTAPPATPAPAPAGSLPFTGGDVAGFAVVGGSLLAAGTLAVVAGRRRRD
jgi:LPXTG-motif cell wall-anchored protein